MTRKYRSTGVVCRRTTGQMPSMGVNGPAAEKLHATVIGPWGALLSMLNATSAELDEATPPVPSSSFTT